MHILLRSTITLLIFTLFSGSASWFSMSILQYLIYFFLNTVAFVTNILINYLPIIFTYFGVFNNHFALIVEILIILVTIWINVKNYKIVRIAMVPIMWIFIVIQFLMKGFMLFLKYITEYISSYPEVKAPRIKFNVDKKIIRSKLIEENMKNKWAFFR